MTLLLNAKEIEGLVTMEECIAAVETAFKEFATGSAQNIPRGRIRLDPSQNGTSFWLNCLPGAVPYFGVCALRVDSVVQTSGAIKERPHGDSVNNRYCGNVFLYSIETGELIAIFPDFWISGLRVGATSAVGTKLLARSDAKQVAVFGSGKQARTNLEGICKVRPIRLVKAYSPNRQHRESFCEEMSKLLGLKVIPAEGPDETIQGADIVLAATNSMQPVFKGTSLGEGVHVITIAASDKHDIKLRGAKRREIDDATIGRASIIGVNSLEQVHLDQQGNILDPIERGLTGWDKIHEIGDLLIGKKRGRERPQEITVHDNNTGLGIQFAAAGALVLKKAREAGLGRELPTEWFMTSLDEWVTKGYSPSY